VLTSYSLTAVDERVSTPMLRSPSMRLARYVSRGKRQSQAEREECQLVMIYKRIDAFFGNIELEDDLSFEPSSVC